VLASFKEVSKNMPNNNKQSSQGSQGQQQNAESQGERGGYGNTSRNAGGSQQGGRGQTITEGQQNMGNSPRPNRSSSRMNDEVDE